MDTWSTPTTVYAAGLRQLPEALAGRDMVLVADGRLAAQIDLVQASGGGRPTLLVLDAGEHDAVDVVLDALARRPAAVPVALGGGSVMDVVRLAALTVLDPSTEKWRRSAAGPLFLPSRAVNPTVCIPSTLGTGSEVSPIAVRHGSDGTTMIVSPALRSAAAIIDPVVTGTLPRAALAAGLVEPWSRVCVPAIAGEPLRFQDGLAAGLGSGILALGDEIADGAAEVGPGWRRAAALASIQTHLGLLPVGRAPAGHVLWPLATEVARATGSTKTQALSALLPAWLACLARGSIGREWGSPDRVRQILGIDADAAPDRVAQWLGGLSLPVHLPPVDVEVVAGHVQQRWQRSGLFLAGVERSDITAVLRAAA